VHFELTVLQFLQVLTSFEENQLQSFDFAADPVLFVLLVPD
jgi:hypothetical protein